jgi:hypothetical protein
MISSKELEGKAKLSSTVAQIGCYVVANHNEHDIIVSRCSVKFATPDTGHPVVVFEGFSYQALTVRGDR